MEIKKACEGETCKYWQCPLENTALRKYCRERHFAKNNEEEFKKALAKKGAPDKGAPKPAPEEEKEVLDIEEDKEEEEAQE